MTLPFPSIGNKLPKFSIKNQNGNTITEEKFFGHYSILYFYPKDDTPGCTQEACNFTDKLTDFNKLSVPIFGVSPDDIESHKKFIDKYKLKINLLADPDKKFCQAMGIIGERNLYGRIVVGILRTTFIIDPKGKIAEIFKNVRVKGHIEKVYIRIKELMQS